MKDPGRTHESRTWQDVKKAGGIAPCCLLIERNLSVDYDTVMLFLTVDFTPLESVTVRVIVFFPFLVYV